MFADLQAEVGEHFIGGHPKEATARRLREKVLEFWPRYAADLASLIRKQPGVVREIIMMKGGPTGR